MTGLLAVSRFRHPARMEGVAKKSKGITVKTARRTLFLTLIGEISPKPAPAPTVIIFTLIIITRHFAGKPLSAVILNPKIQDYSHNHE